MRVSSHSDPSPSGRGGRLLAAAAAGVVCLAFLSFLRPNLSTSVPGSLFLEIPFSAPRVGELATVCLGGEPGRFLLDRRPEMAGGFLCGRREARLAKFYLAGEGSVVEVREDGVRLDGRPIPHGAPRAADSRGEALPVLRGRFELRADEAWLYGSGEGSYDSRYFGPVPLRWLKARLVTVVD